MSFTAYGTSFAFSISAEDIENRRYNHRTETPLKIKPPEINNGNAVSHAMDKWTNPWKLWTLEKVVEPKYDGYADRFGIISNRPDHIKESHFIGLMRLTDKLLAPDYKSNISVSATMPAPHAPVAPPKT